MQKSMTAVLITLLLVTFGSLTTAQAQPSRVDGAGQVQPIAPESFFLGPDAVRPIPTFPDDWVVLPMWGDVWANGRHIGPVDFVAFWERNAEQPHAELWAIWRGRPMQVCVGVIFETPQGEPIFFGTTTVDEPRATCHMARTPDFDEISLFIATEDGQWATSIMSDPTWKAADAALILG